jgi:hypothetical protein
MGYARIGASHKDDDQPLCQHQLRTESQCDICLSLTQEWSEFKAEVDDVGTLGTGPMKEIIRVVTRSQATDSKLCNQVQQIAEDA